MVYDNYLCILYIEKFITLVWQVDNVLIEAGSLIQAGGFYYKFYGTRFWSQLTTGVRCAWLHRDCLSRAV